MSMYIKKNAISQFKQLELFKLNNRADSGEITADERAIELAKLNQFCEDTLNSNQDFDLDILADQYNS